MTPAADDPPLWPEGWWVEPCDTAPPPAPPPARIPRWMKRTVTVRPIDDYPEGASQCPDPT